MSRIPVPALQIPSGRLPLPLANQSGSLRNRSEEKIHALKIRSLGYFLFLQAVGQAGHRLMNLLFCGAGWRGLAPVTEQAGFGYEKKMVRASLKINKFQLA